jgi:hypothetical protein
VDGLPIPRTAVKALQRNRIDKVGQLIQLLDADQLRMPGLDSDVVRQINRALSELPRADLARPSSGSGADDAPGE